MATGIVIAERPEDAPTSGLFYEAIGLMNNEIPMCLLIKRDKCWRARLSLKFWNEHRRQLEKAGFYQSYIAF